MSGIHTPKKITEIPSAIIKNMITLSTSGLGLVVALAWNEAIKSFVDTYINPWLGTGSGVISLFIYAIFITLIAIFVTMQLASLEMKFEKLGKIVKNSDLKKLLFQTINKKNPPKKDHE